LAGFKKKYRPINQELPKKDRFVLLRKLLEKKSAPFLHLALECIGYGEELEQQGLVKKYSLRPLY
jgi:hypothetical protein